MMMLLGWPEPGQLYEFEGIGDSRKFPGRERRNEVPSASQPRHESRGSTASWSGTWGSQKNRV
jgi:hypothetical protein